MHEGSYWGDTNRPARRPCMPAPATLAYVANALTVVFLLLALPYAAHRFFKSPTAAIRGAGRKQVG